MDSSVYFTPCCLRITIRDMKNLHLTLWWFCVVTISISAIYAKDGSANITKTERFA